MFVGHNKLKIAWTSYLNGSTAIFPLHSVQVVYYATVVVLLTSACTYMPVVSVYYKSLVNHFGTPAPFGSRAPVHIPQWRQGTVIDLLVCTPRRQKFRSEPRALIRNLQEFHGPFICDSIRLTRPLHSPSLPG